MIKKISADIGIEENEALKAVTRLVSAKNEEEIMAVFNHYLSEYSYQICPEYAEALADLRGTLSLAMNLKSMLDNGRLSNADFAKAGVIIGFGGDDWPALNGSWYQIIKSNSYFDYLQKSIDDFCTPIGDGQPALVKEFSPEELKEFSDFWELDIPEQTSSCAVFTFFAVGAGCFGDDDESRSALATVLLDYLCTINLYGLRIEIRNTMEVRKSSNLFSSLWCALVASFSSGRIDICQTCGAHFIAFGERGKKRKYCSEACNKKHQRLMVFEREILKGENDKDAAKKAGISLETAKRILG